MVEFVVVAAVLVSIVVVVAAVVVVVVIITGCGWFRTCIRNHVHSLCLSCRFLLEDCWIASCIVLERMIQKSLVRPVRSGVVSVLWTIIDFGSFVCCFVVSVVCCCLDAKRTMMHDDGGANRSIKFMHIFLVV